MPEWLHIKKYAYFSWKNTKICHDIRVQLPCLFFPLVVIGYVTSAFASDFSVSNENKNLLFPSQKNPAVFSTAETALVSGGVNCKIQYDERETEAMMYHMIRHGEISK